MQDFSVTIIQSNLHWENISSNLEMFSQKIKAIASETNLIVLPEMFSTGFSMKPDLLGEDMDGKTIQWMKEMAFQTNAIITGSMIAKENGQFYNRLIWMRPDGEFKIYNKRHLFTLANEHMAYSPGKKKLIVEWKGWKICPLICYDLRFPVWSRNQEGYDLLIYVANWPKVRAHAWKSLLVARAIENQAYTIGVNRVGVDGNDLAYSGDSTILDFAGQTLFQETEKEAIHTIIFSKTALNTFRSKRAFLPDQDKFEINL